MLSPAHYIYLHTITLKASILKCVGVESLLCASTRMAFRTMEPILLLCFPPFHEKHRLCSSRRGLQFTGNCTALCNVMGTPVRPIGPGSRDPCPSCPAYLSLSLSLRLSLPGHAGGVLRILGLITRGQVFRVLSSSCAVLAN